MGKNFQNIRAFCEGRQEKAFGLSGGSNPHPVDSEAYTAWDTGFALEVVTGVNDACNITAGVTVPDLVEITAAEAQAALEAVGLVLGTTALTVDPVASQNPAAAATVKPGTAVNITLTS